MRRALLLSLACCASPAAQGGHARPAPADASAPAPLDGGAHGDAVDASRAPDAAPDAGATSDWATYVIAPGAHAATIVKGAAGNPRAGFCAGVAERAYDLALDPSAMYVLTAPVQPNDQLDWNKLPGLSDCDQLDLAQDGAMFGWRWRPDLTPPVLELTAYANDGGEHLAVAPPMATLDAADLSAASPLHYRVAMDGALYRFSIAGKVRGRAVDAEATLPRRCAEKAPGGLVVQWAAGLYFGGTSTAPQTVTARVFEP